MSARPTIRARFGIRDSRVSAAPERLVALAVGLGPADADIAQLPVAEAQQGAALARAVVPGQQLCRDPTGRLAHAACPTPVTPERPVAKAFREHRHLSSPQSPLCCWRACAASIRTSSERD